MLKLHWIEFFLRGIPEMFLVIWGISIICKASLNIKKYVLLSITMSIFTFLIRGLPIYFGVHTMLIAIISIIVIILAGIPVISAIYGTLVMALLLSLSEFLNMILLNLLNIASTVNSIDPIKKCLLGIPSLIILFLMILTLNCILTRREKSKNVSN